MTDGGHRVGDFGDGGGDGRGSGEDVGGAVQVVRFRWLGFGGMPSSSCFSAFFVLKILDPELFEHMKQNGDYTHFYFCYRWFLLDFKRGNIRLFSSVLVQFSPLA